MPSLILFILLLILTIVIYIAVRKYAPVYFLRESAQEPPEVDEDETGDFVSDQARLDLLHFRDTKTQYERLRETLNAEIKAIEETREKKKHLSALIDNPCLYADLYCTIDHQRDISERRVATLQRQLITVENHIYNCDKRISKAKKTIAEAN